MMLETTPDELHRRMRAGGPATRLRVWWNDGPGARYRHRSGRQWAVRGATHLVGALAVAAASVTVLGPVRRLDDILFYGATGQYVPFALAAAAAGVIVWCTLRGLTSLGCAWIARAITRSPRAAQLVAAVEANRLGCGTVLTGLATAIAAFAVRPYILGPGAGLLDVMVLCGLVTAGIALVTMTTRALLQLLRRRRERTAIAAARAYLPTDL